MSVFKIALTTSVFCLLLCSDVVLHADDPAKADYQIFSVHMNHDTAKMNVSGGASFAFVKPIVDALQAHEVSSVTMSVSENGTTTAKSGSWFHVVVDDVNDVDQSSILLCVSPDTPVALVSTLAGNLSTVDGRPVRFLSQRAFDSFVSQVTIPSLQQDAATTSVTEPQKSK